MYPWRWNAFKRLVITCVLLWTLKIEDGQALVMLSDLLLMACVLEHAGELWVSTNPTWIDSFPDWNWILCLCHAPRLHYGVMVMTNQLTLMCMIGMTLLALRHDWYHYAVVLAISRVKDMY